LGKCVYIQIQYCEGDGNNVQAVCMSQGCARVREDLYCNKRRAVSEAGKASPFPRQYFSRRRGFPSSGRLPKGSAMSNTLVSISMLLVLVPDAVFLPGAMPSLLEELCSYAQICDLTRNGTSHRESGLSACSWTKLTRIIVPAKASRGQLPPSICHCKRQSSIVPFLSLSWWGGLSGRHGL
jgi:hypothetical protein